MGVAVTELATGVPTGDRGKGSYVAIVHPMDEERGRYEALELKYGAYDEQVQDFDTLVKLAEENLRSGYGDVGMVEVVELAVVRRAVLKRAVEVSIQ